MRNWRRQWLGAATVWCHLLTTLENFVIFSRRLNASGSQTKGAHQRYFSVRPRNRAHRRTHRTLGKSWRRRSEENNTQSSRPRPGSQTPMTEHGPDFGRAAATTTNPAQASRTQNQPPTGARSNEGGPAAHAPLAFPVVNLVNMKLGFGRMESDQYIEAITLNICLFVYWGFRAQRLLWSLCAHNTC